jgi:hypothetical protein
LLPVKKIAERHEWDGNLKVYFGKVHEGNLGVSQAWPQSGIKDMSYQQTIASAKAFKHISFPSSDANLRIYFAPTKTAWTPPTVSAPEGVYKENASMLILYVDPSTGDKKSALFSPTTLYKLRTNPKNLLDQTMSSIWYRVKAGGLAFGLLESAGEERTMPVNLFTTQIFVYDNSDTGGFIYGAGEDDPKAEPAASGNDVICFARILEHAQGNVIGQAELQAAVRDATTLMQSL